MNRCATTFLIFSLFSQASSHTEAMIAVQALRLNTLSKLTFADSNKFDDLVKDIFTEVEFKEVEYAELRAALIESFEENDLIFSEIQVRTLLLVSIFMKFCISFYYFLVFWGR